MKHRPLEEITEVAKITPVGPEGARALRRQRLERLASLLDEHKRPVRLFSGVEWIPEEERLTLRQDDSPLTIAYLDPAFRRQGLLGDRFGDAMAFFGLSMREAHRLFCDCGYVGTAIPRSITSDMLAQRARSLATKVTFAEIWAKLRRAAAGRWR